MRESKSLFKTKIEFKNRDILMINNFYGRANIKHITVIIVNYKSEEIIKNAIESIKENFLDISILILDNGGNSQSYAKLLDISNNNNKVKVISSKENLGFAGGVNYAYMYLKNNNILPKYIFLLNPDAVIQQNMIFNLYSILEDNTDAAAISPHIVNNDGHEEYAGFKINWKKCTIGKNLNITKITAAKIRAVDVFHGCAVLLDAKKFYKAGMFDENIFMYYDEAFLSMEFVKLSYKVLYSPDDITRHYGSYSAESYSSTRSYYHTRNHLLFFKKYSKKSNIFCKYKAIIITVFSSIKHTHFKKLLGELKGIFDFWMGKIGKI